MKSPSILILAIFASAAAPAWGQAGQAGAFLRQDATARAAALGGAVTALADDSSALLQNPAGLAKLAKPEVGATHIVLFEDTSFDYITGGLASQRWGGFAFGYAHQASGGFEARQGPNDSPTDFSITQTAFLGGWGRSFDVPGLKGSSWAPRSKPLSVGVAVKAVSESIGSASAAGHGADIGALFQPDDHLSFGLAVSNLFAPSLTYVSQPVAYPRVVDVSPAYHWNLSTDVRALAAVKVSKTDGESALISGGVELQYQKLLAIRLGTRDKSLTTGIGVRLGNSSFDYAAQLGDLGVGNFFTFTQRFGQTPEEL
ncbi:MAG TPA: UPF0164 family protein, partial [Elusimicrobiota bacterium]|nr:UPF0164 family protein [Elusimicrobiota bacterium]